MRINDLKERLCDIIESAYQTAVTEGHHEIIQPFRIVIGKDGSVDYAPLRASRTKEHLSLKS